MGYSVNCLILDYHHSSVAGHIQVITAQSNMVFIADQFY